MFLGRIGSYKIIKKISPPKYIPKVKQDDAFLERSKISKDFVRKGSGFWNQVFNKDSESRKSVEIWQGNQQVQKDVSNPLSEMIYFIIKNGLEMYKFGKFDTCHLLDIFLSKK